MTSMAAAVPPVMPSPFGNVSLYVGDLDSAVNESDLYDLFSRVCPVASIRVCRDQNKRYSLGYAYVNFTTHDDAAKAKEKLNFSTLKGKPIRIMFSQRDPSIRKSGYGNVFIKNLDAFIDNKALYELFTAYGNVLSCKVATDGKGQVKGFGYVQFEKEGDAQTAIKSLNGMLLNDKQIYVGQHVRHLERLQENGSPKFTNVYVKNLCEATTDEDLEKLFGTYGAISSAVVMKDQDGKSRCFGFVNFQTTEAAAAAVEQLNGTTHDDKVWYVGRAQRKSEREAQLRAKFEQERLGRYEKYQGANLYLKNLDDNIDDEKLKDMFSKFGTIKSCKIMLDPQGFSRGSGFVAFSTPEEATVALNEMNGKMVGRKPLYVAVAQRKEERKARLQAHFAQLQAQGGMVPFTSGFPGYHPASPRIGPQQLYFGQPTAGVLATQPAGYGFQQPLQLLPGMRPNMSPNYMMQFGIQRQGQPLQRFGFRRGGNPQHQQQIMHRNASKGFRHMGNGKNGTDASVVPYGLMGPIMPVPHMVETAAAAAKQVPRSMLTSALASATPEDCTRMLGERLYPLVERLEPENVSKVTGMLLEMDQTEVLHLMESPDALKEKVAEAMVVLRRAAAADSGPHVHNELASLTTVANE